jgi:hypothetical protein
LWPLFYLDQSPGNATIRLTNNKEDTMDFNQGINEDEIIRKHKELKERVERYEILSKPIIDQMKKMTELSAPNIILNPDGSMEYIYPEAYTRFMEASNNMLKRIYDEVVLGPPKTS